MRVRVVGGGLAGCEIVWQLAQRGHDVVLHEQKPHARTPAQTTDHLAELVCSNSFRGAALTNAVGLLKEELRRLGSLIMQCADETRVPAGGALAVDRDRFAAAVERALHQHPRVRIEHGEVRLLPPTDEGPVVLATGPLTSDALAEHLEKVTGGRLAYYDAIAPIVSAEGIDTTKVFAASRWGKGSTPAEATASTSPEVEQPDPAEGAGDVGDAAYLNVPLDRAEYEAFVQAILQAEKVAPRAFEQLRYFEGCLPIEAMAERGLDTLRYGPMKPVGLIDPATGRRPWAVVQLRMEDQAGSAYNMVGFQTRMTYGAQAQVFRMLPGLASAEFLRFGSVHRNTFVQAPTVLDRSLQVKNHPGLYLAGQITGVEGYVESTACGLACGLFLARHLAGLPFVPLPETTALGGLLGHLSNPSKPTDFQPSNVTWALIAPLPVEASVDGRGRKLPKVVRYERLAERALADLDSWRRDVVVPIPSA